MQIAVNSFDFLQIYHMNLLLDWDSILFLLNVDLS